MAGENVAKFFPFGGMVMQVMQVGGDAGDAHVFGKDKLQILSNRDVDMVENMFGKASLEIGESY